MTVNRSVSISKVLTIAPVTMVINYKMVPVRTLMNVLIHHVANCAIICRDPSSVTVTMVTTSTMMGNPVLTLMSVTMTTVGVTTTATTLMEAITVPVSLVTTNPLSLHVKMLTNASIVMEDVINSAIMFPVPTPAPASMGISLAMMRPPATILTSVLTTLHNVITCASIDQEDMNVAVIVDIDCFEMLQYQNIMYMYHIAVSISTSV